jgi:SAM-dependent methyltransferase
MISPTLLSLVRCPECHGRLVPRARTDTAPLDCTGCGRSYARGDGFLDLRPDVQFTEQTKYLDAALHADARHARVSPPLLGSRIRNDMLRAFLRPRPSDRVIDLGCGSGRTLLWNRGWGAAAVGVDIAPYFSAEALSHVDLLLADLRRLPFGEGTFSKAYSLDVLEHLSPESVAAMLAEAGRVLQPGGTLFVYTHVRRNARIAAGLRWINAFGRWLERAGLIDARQERLRKSDHLNPIADIAELETIVRRAGFRIARIRYYTPIVGGLVENILIRLAEGVMARRAARRLPAGAPDTDAAAIREARATAKSAIARSRTVYAALRLLSLAMKLDLVLFGRVRSGPFFALLEKIPDEAAVLRD